MALQALTVYASPQQAEAGSLRQGHPPTWRCLLPTLLVVQDFTAATLPGGPVWKEQLRPAEHKVSCAVPSPALHLTAQEAAVLCGNAQQNSGAPQLHAAPV